MKIIFLVECIDNLTASNLVKSFSNTEHIVDVVSYFDNDQKQCVVVENGNIRTLLYNKRLYTPSEYDAALLWCWGTAHIGRDYLRIFEEQGVFVVNSAYDTEVTDSKNKLTAMLKYGGVSIPKTLFFDKGLCFDAYQKKLSLLEPSLGAHPYVFKPNYGTRGRGIQFVNSIEEINNITAMLDSKKVLNDGFILQEFIGDAGQAISHYRTLVLGESVFPYVLKITASSPMKVSNIAEGGLAEIVNITPDLTQASLLAAKVSGLKMAGVDLMVKNAESSGSAIVVLEVNDGPGTKTFDQAGCNASDAVVDFFINYVENGMSTAMQQASL
ncbi:MAG: glutathione synthase/RimK-type ligase-like ATP-grasp enzyme [Cellvibrionaceae bacterium]|jgi:glutathione synthase/RimK-type ligase-like ATP-grasp enzyme